MKATDGYIEQDSAGIRLLKKSKKGLLRIVFSRTGLIILLLLIQVAILFGLFFYARGILPYYYVAEAVFTAIMVLYLFNSSHDPTAKLSWLALIMVLPVFGALLFLYTHSNLGHRILRDRFAQVSNDSSHMLEQNKEVFDRFKTEAPEAAGLARYLKRGGCHPVFDKTAVKYFPSGEDKFAELLIQLKKAEKFIFLEYFIIDEGLMWGKVLEILAEKAAQGVEVRMMYDGTCEFTRLPHDYAKRLEELNIKCKIFAPLTPFVSTHYNYRDHRKILVVDGKVAFTGGINLADEYINVKERFGHWKDTAVMVEGEAAKSFTLMFLQMWNVSEKEPENYGRYLSTAPHFIPDAPGYVIPYGDCPLDNERVGEWLYLDLLNRARDYIYIMTPYLILDGEMETAIKFAAERGVDVRLILPGIPDKKLPYALAKTHYKSLLESGVKIYEYSPGFVHAKVFVADDREAVVGTINLDYRSLYHHFECAAYMYEASCIPDIKADFLQTEEKCRTVTPETVKKEKFSVKAAGVVMKAIAPLM